MDLAGIKVASGECLIELELFRNQVAWLHESIAPDRDIAQMKAWLEKFYDNLELSEEEFESLTARAMMHPKNVEPEFIFNLSTFAPILYSILEDLEKIEAQKKTESPKK